MREPKADEEPRKIAENRFFHSKARRIRIPDDCRIPDLIHFIFYAFFNFFFSTVLPLVNCRVKENFRKSMRNQRKLRKSFNSMKIKTEI